jgi:hypothetical protein
MMRGSTGFDAYEARRQILEEWHNVAALELAANDYMTCRVNSVDLKNRLCNIETNCRDRLHVWLLRIRGGLNSTHINGTSAPVEEPSTASKADIRTATNARLFGHLVGAGEAVHSIGTISFRTEEKSQRGMCLQRHTRRKREGEISIQ